jgi:hypothetical protein
MNEPNLFISDKIINLRRLGKIETKQKNLDVKQIHSFFVKDGKSPIKHPKPIFENPVEPLY